MDEHKLAEAFRAAAGDAPPASFDETDVARRSRRVTARRRTATASGTLLGAALLVTGISVGTGMLDAPSGPDTTTMADPGQHTDQRPAPQGGEPGQVAPLEVPDSRDTKSGGVPLDSPRTSGGTGCAPDQTLASALAGELPPSAGTHPAPAGECPTGGRGAGFDVTEGPHAGTVTVTVNPVGVVPPEQAKPGPFERPDGSQGAVARSRSGKILTVLSDPQPESPAAPEAGRVGEIADRLATRF